MPNSENEAGKAAYEWLKKRGGDAAVAKTKAGGQQILAQGDVAPFTAVTRKKMVLAGMAEYYQAGQTKRFRLIEKNHAA